jgi:high-affinity Fe2+/Pb2+ permease
MHSNWLPTVKAVAAVAVVISAIAIAAIMPAISINSVQPIRVIIRPVIAVIIAAIIGWAVTRADITAAQRGHERQCPDGFYSPFGPEFWKCHGFDIDPVGAPAI